MKTTEVPQDPAKSFAGERKLLYAVDESGSYTGVRSAGWEVEDFATQAAVAEINRLREEALADAKAGKVSPLVFHMYDRRMEPATLSQATGLPGWRVRRHFRPDVFAGLPARLLRRYAEAMGVAPDDLRRLPDAP
jgi:hypothetical protein